MAASNGHFEVVRFLLDEGADIDAQRESGETALHKASASDHVQVGKHLLGLEANKHAEQMVGKTPLEVSNGQETKALLSSWQ